MSAMHRAVGAFLFLMVPVAAQAAGDICSSDTLPAASTRPTFTASVASELAPAVTQFGGASGVLAQSFDEALSVDNVLARIRVDGCRAMAAKSHAPAGALDPAAYKPQTAFDNTPWRFNMTQNGKRMTADEFDAWMKSRGVRVAGRKDPVPVAEAPAAGEPDKKAAN